jgi:hypothetical protein
MIRSRKIAFPLAAALTVSLVSIWGFALQAKAAPPAQSAPASGASPKLIKAKFTVLRMLYNSIQVRGVENPLENHTFSYSDAIRGKMQKVFSQGGYQYGDRVEIWYERSADVASKIKGKRSKSH